MPYLNLSDTPLKIEVIAHPQSEPGFEVQSSLALSQKGLRTLATDFAELLESFRKTGSSSELRVVLSEEWVLFCKIRENGNRSLLAHPEKEKWVATLALEASAAEALILAFQSLGVGQSLVLSQTVLLDRVSNLDWVFRIENSF